MSSPQVENGFLRIANELYFAALRYQFKQHHKAVYEAIFMKTFGFNKKEDDISLSQLELMTGILSSNCSKACRQLVDLNVIHRRKGAYGHIMGIKKDYRAWHGWDRSWEHWNKSKNDGIVDESASGEEGQDSSSSESPVLTDEEARCWELAKKHDYWAAKVATVTVFLSVYRRVNSGLKKQYEDGSLILSGEPKKFKKSSGEYQYTPSDVELDGGDFLTGEYEVICD